MESVFNLKDYKLLNKDLRFKTDEEYLNHWNRIGMKQCRLCNQSLLIATNEFGIEILFYVGYYYYLFTSNLLFNNRIISYKGMEPYYYFLPRTQLSLQSHTRKYTKHQDCMLTKYLKLNNDNPNAPYYDLNLKFWKPPDYRTYYDNNKNTYFHYDKEILIVNNKYNREWEALYNRPVNFLDLPTLHKIFTYLSPKYQVIYIRPTTSIQHEKEYSFDSNAQLKLNDFELIRTKFPNVILFDDLLNNDLRFQHMNYNLLKCYLLASCTKYISVQGGANNLFSYFAKSMLIYHKHGFEAEANVYTVRSKLQSTFEDFSITHKDNYDELIRSMKEMY